MAEKQSNDQTGFHKYDFTTNPIKRIKFGDERIDSIFASSEPVIIENSELVASALRWNLDYLCEHIGTSDFSVYESDSYQFRYFDEKKIVNYSQFQPPTKRVELKFSEFHKRVKNFNPTSDKKIYLQQPLNNTVGKQIVIDFLKFKWDWVKYVQEKNKWGPLTSNLLLIGLPGNITPVHYDEQENIFCQVRGRKRVILFPPSQFSCFYPYPVSHPHDRQSQVDFHNPDLEKFPCFKNASGFDGVLSPGDVLYLPMYWWHYFESESGADAGPTVSVTFWYKAASTGEITYPLKPQQKVAMSRNIEKMIGEALNITDEIEPFMRDMVLGRYTHSL